jgi:hypothetical protein
MREEIMKFNVKAFALTCGILWGISLFFLTWWIIFFEGPTKVSTILSLGYRGYTFTPMGSFIGFVWGFFDGLIGGAIFAWLYNRLA